MTLLNQLLVLNIFIANLVCFMLAKLSLKTNVQFVRQVTLSTFFHISVEEQIKHFFEKRNLAQILDDNRKSVTQESLGLITDITDGSEYLRVKCSLPGRYDLILALNTDIKLGLSSMASLWPGMCTICEVPPQLRKQFVILGYMV